MMINKIPNLLHKLLERIIISSIKRNLTKYELEKIKILTVSIICSILFVFILAIGIIKGDSIGISTFADILSLYVFISISFFLITIMYAFSYLLPFLRTSNNNCTSFAFFTSIFRANFFILIPLGICLDIILYCLFVMLGLLIGFPIAVLNIIKILNNLKESNQYSNYRL